MRRNVKYAMSYHVSMIDKLLDSNYVKRAFITKSDEAMNTGVRFSWLQLVSPHISNINLDPRLSISMPQLICVKKKNKENNG